MIACHAEPGSATCAQDLAAAQPFSTLRYNHLTGCGAVAELADAADSKSAGIHFSSRFDPEQRHHIRLKSWLCKLSGGSQPLTDLKNTLR